LPDLDLGPHQQSLIDDRIMFLPIASQLDPAVTELQLVPVVPNLRHWVPGSASVL